MHPELLLWLSKVLGTLEMHEGLSFPIVGHEAGSVIRLLVASRKNNFSPSLILNIHIWFCYAQTLIIRISRMSATWWICKYFCKWIWKDYEFGFNSERDREPMKGFNTGWGHIQGWTASASTLPLHPEVHESCLCLYFFSSSQGEKEQITHQAIK